MQIAVEPDGTAIAVWRRGAGSGEVTVQSSVRPAGGTWQAPIDISAPGLDGSATLDRAVLGPQLALDARGNAVAVWQRSNGTSLVVQAAERPAGGAWKAPVVISAPGGAGEDAGSPRVAIDPLGSAVAVWHRRDPVTQRSRVQSAVRPAGGSWQPPVAVSALGVDATGARLAIDARGAALALWTGRTDQQSTTGLQSAVRGIDGIWQAPQDIPGSGATATFDIAVAPSGEALVLWDRLPLQPQVLAALRPADGSWQTPVGLSTTGFAPTVAVDAGANATAVWGVDGGVVSATRPAGGDWTPAVSIDATAGASIPNVVVDRRGDAIAAWANDARPGAMVRRRVAGAWQETIRLSTDGRSPATPELALDPNGNALAAWSDAVAGVVTAAGFDGAAPELRAVTVPATAGAGRAVSFSASPFDVWSAPSAASWSFGDGATAIGNRVAHAYANLGRRTVDVTTTDALGNATTTTNAIVVNPSVLGLRVTPYAFRRSRPGSIGFRLAVASSVRFDAERAGVGRRVGGRCVSPTAANRRRAVCTRYARAGSFTRSRPAGRSRFKVPVRIAGRRLKAGRYRMSATPSAASLAGAPSRTGFRVTR